jgi:dTDP-4-amino-4,6-dideoxygalactose transaminase
VPANTFIATALAVSHVGAVVVPVDVDPKTNLMAAELVSERITPRTAAVIPVHLFGKPVEMDPLLSLCGKHGVAVLEDACQTHGAMYDGRRAGSFGVAAAFSFYPGKNLGAYEDGGAIVTSDDALAAKIRLLRDLGQERKYVHTVLGFNSRLDGLQAAILSAKLPHLDAWNEKRRAIAERYDREFVRAGIKTNSACAGTSVQHLYCVRVPGRARVTEALDATSIGYGIHYPTPIHLHAAYADLGYSAGAFPVSEKWSEQTLSLPIYAELTGEEVDRIIDVVTTAVQAQVQL